MKKVHFKLPALLLVAILSLTLIINSSFKEKEKVKIGFLIHDLVSDRWKMDVGFFTNKVEALGGEVVLKNALGDPRMQVTQGKMMIDEGIKVIAVVPQSGTVLAELVNYANKAGAKIIAYDRMINNCDLHYYVSFNSVKVGEMMTDYALRTKPKGNYVILKGPASDNNAILVMKGIMNKLSKPIENGSVKIILEKEIEEWYGLNSFMAMDEFLAVNKLPVDAIIASSDDLATGAIDAIKNHKLKIPVITGQDASVDACKNILNGSQSMTMYKSIKKLASEAAILAMKVAKNEKVELDLMINNGKKEVPSLLFDPLVVDKSNLKILVTEGHLKEADLN